MKKTEREQVVQDVGLNPEDTDVWTNKWRNHRTCAGVRDLNSNLTFSEYVQKAVEAGITNPELIGSGKEKFNLGRVGDVGDYGIENCRFIPAVQNISEAHQNGLHGNSYLNAGTINRARMTGETKETSERVRKMAETKTGRTKENDLGRAAQAAKLAKPFVLTAPDGNQHVGTNLAEFCEKNDLSKFAMYGVLSGKRPHHKGWTGSRDEPDTTLLK